MLVGQDVDDLLFQFVGHRVIPPLGRFDQVITQLLLFPSL